MTVSSRAGLPPASTFARQLPVAAHELHLHVLHPVRQVPALDRVGARRLRRGRDLPREERRLRQPAVPDEGRHDDRVDDLAVLAHLALVEVEHGHREDAGAVVGLDGLDTAGEDAARVVGRELEEAADRVAVAVAGYRQIPSSRSTPAIVCTAASRSASRVGGGDRDPQARLVLRHRGVGHRVEEQPPVLDLLRHREDPRVVVDHHRHDLRVGLADVDALLREPPAQERHVAPQLRPQLGLRGRDPQAGEEAGGERRARGCRRRSASARRR